jgi:hypothetical protein
MGREWGGRGRGGIEKVREKEKKKSCSDICEFTNQLGPL